ncbi:DUF1127 domain-containing protein [Bradyrhizobium sp. McL0616]|uniref:DUF1127 domain-containing protein n=1 Tax=Bradyrhizobium sp. McL0616 TaxID=3415674 RepID=UPI003CF88E3D
MATTYNASTSRQTFSPIRLGLSFLGDRCAALHEWYGCQRIRARLLALSDRELYDIGISRGEIDYVASNPDVDPRGTRRAE